MHIDGDVLAHFEENRFLGQRGLRTGACRRQMMLGFADRACPGPLVKSNHVLAVLVVPIQRCGLGGSSRKFESERAPVLLGVVVNMTNTSKIDKTHSAQGDYPQAFAQVP